MSAAATPAPRPALDARAASPGASVAPTDLKAPTPDGGTIAATWWDGADAANRAVVLLPAMATPARFYRAYAQHLADRGWGVLTFDYRGVGASRVADDAEVTLDTWSQHDLMAAYEAVVAEGDDPLWLGVVAHSVGGQLFGQSPLRKFTHGALFVGSQRGMPHLFEGIWRARLEVAWRLIPAAVHAFGRLPRSALTLREHVPPKALLQWVRWSQSGRFTDWEGHDVEALFADYANPLTTIALGDDHGYAPPAAVEALAACYTGTQVRKRVMEPTDLGLDSIGHFGVFRPGRPAVWAELDAELEALRTPLDPFRP